MPDPSPADSESNPHAASERFLLNDGILPEGELERIRGNSIEHEKSIQALGKFYSLFGWLFFIASAQLLWKTLAGVEKERELALPFLLVCGVLMALFFLVAYGLANLQNWARIVAGILAVPGLLLFPFVTPAAAYALYLLFSETGGFVCSEEYGSVIQATPHVNGRAPLIINALYFMAILLVLGLIIARILFEMQAPPVPGKP